jgi:hypothetical protein
MEHSGALFDTDEPEHCTFGGAKASAKRSELHWTVRSWVKKDGHLVPVDKQQRVLPWWRVNANRLHYSPGRARRVGRGAPPSYAPCREVSGNLIGDCLRRGTSMASGPRIAASKEGVPAMFGGVVSLNLINDFATNRTKSNKTAVPYITEAGT